MTTQRIGTVKGPGETPSEFTVIAPDPERLVKHGEFVYYMAHVDGRERRILGRISAREAVKLYPDAFMADPGVPPAEINPMSTSGLSARKAATLQSSRFRCAKGSNV